MFAGLRTFIGRPSRRRQGTGLQSSDGQRIGIGAPRRAYTGWQRVCGLGAVARGCRKGFTAALARDFGIGATGGNLTKDCASILAPGRNARGS